MRTTNIDSEDARVSVPAARPLIFEIDVRALLARLFPLVAVHHAERNNGARATETSG